MSTKVEMTYRTDAMSHSLAFSTTIMITRESIENLPVGHPFRTVGPEGIVDRLADDSESLPDRLRLLANMYETLYGHDRVLTTGTVVDMAIRSGVTPAEFVRRWHKQAIANLPPAKVRLRALDLGDG